MTDTDPGARFGDLAVEMGFITTSQLEGALSRQDQLSEMLGIRARLADMLIEQGVISPDQRDRVLARQAGKRVIGNYELLKKLGEGGMGSVFLARQISMDRHVALKILSPALAKNPTQRDRFLVEARAVAKLNHPNIVKGYDVGHAEGLYYFAMEFVPGRNLADQVRGGKSIPWKRVTDFGAQCSQALKHAADRGIIHRDIKPENLLVLGERNPKGKMELTVKVADLGLAWVKELSNNEGEKKVFGTPHYLSPEQAKGTTDLDARTDIYSLGLTLYRLLTGKRPFEKKDARGAMIAHLNSTVPSPIDLIDNVPDALCRILENMTAKKRELRYPDWEWVIEDFESFHLQEEMHALGMPRGYSSIAPPRSMNRASGGFAAFEDPEDDVDWDDLQAGGEEEVGRKSSGLAAMRKKSTVRRAKRLKRRRGRR